MSQSKKSTLNTFKEALPLIYIFLVCFGYFNKSLFFAKFGIDVLYYLTVQELVLSFIPVGSAIVIVILFVILILAPIIVFGDNKTIESKMEKDRFNLYEDIDKIKYNTIRRFSKHIYWIISIVTGAYLNFVPLLIVVYWVIFSKIRDSLPDSKILVLLMIIWGILFLLKYRFQNSKKNTRVHLFVYFTLMIVVFIVYSDMNLKRADRIKNGEPEYSIHLISDKKEIKTSKELIFFGQTNDFVFLRNTITNENRVYKKNDFNELIIKKLKK